MSSGYITLPGGSRIPPHVNRRICAGSKNDFSSLQYREWVGSSILVSGNDHSFVFSERVPDGFYWWIIALAGMNSDPANNRAFGFHMVPGQFNPDASLFQGAGNGGPTQGSVKIDGGLPGTAQTQNSTQVDNVKVPFSLPSRWFLMGLEEQAGLAVNALRHYTLRAAFFQVPNGELAPGMF